MAFDTNQIAQANTDLEFKKLFAKLVTHVDTGSTLLEGVLDVTAGTATLSKALVLGATKNIDTFRMTGILWKPAPAPQVATNTATLTAAQILGHMLVATPTSAAALTFPSGTDLQTAALVLHPELTAGDSFDLSVINLGATTDLVTMTASSGVTLVGSGLVGAVADVATVEFSSGLFRFRYTAANTFVAYRLA